MPSPVPHHPLHFPKPYTCPPVLTRTPLVPEGISISSSFSEPEAKQRSPSGPRRLCGWEPGWWEGPLHSVCKALTCLSQNISFKRKKERNALRKKRKLWWTYRAIKRGASHQQAPPDSYLACSYCCQSSLGISQAPATPQKHLPSMVCHPQAAVPTLLAAIMLSVSQVTHCPLLLPFTSIV